MFFIKIFVIIIIVNEKVGIIIMMMNKCYFCEKSTPEGKCWWAIQSWRENDCRKAIERMIKAFNGKIPKEYKNE